MILLLLVLVLHINESITAVLTNPGALRLAVSIGRRSCATTIPPIYDSRIEEDKDKPIDCKCLLALPCFHALLLPGLTSSSQTTIPYVEYLTALG